MRALGVGARAVRPEWTGARQRLDHRGGRTPACVARGGGGRRVACHEQAGREKVRRCDRRRLNIQIRTCPPPGPHCCSPPFTPPPPPLVFPPFHSPPLRLSLALTNLQVGDEAHVQPRQMGRRVSRDQNRRGASRIRGLLRERARRRSGMSSSERDGGRWCIRWR